MIIFENIIEAKKSLYNARQEVRKHQALAAKENLPSLRQYSELSVAITSAIVELNEATENCIKHSIQF